MFRHMDWTGVTCPGTWTEQVLMFKNVDLNQDTARSKTRTIGVKNQTDSRGITCSEISLNRYYTFSNQLRRNRCDMLRKQD